jgi:uncharacterized RmlC-like cupin family protein
MAPLNDSTRIVALARDGLTAAPGYPGITREIAFESDRALQVRVRGEGLAATGWHHHGEREVFGYLAKGRARFEFGPGGRESVDVEAGGFFRVPAGLIHRDVNPIDEEQEFVLVFAGAGPLVVDVEGPAGAGAAPAR